MSDTVDHTIIHTDSPTLYIITYNLNLAESNNNYFHAFSETVSMTIYFPCFHNLEIRKNLGFYIIMWFATKYGGGVLATEVTAFIWQPVH